jgi:ribose-phosphate pyrophosphokinase
LQDSGIREVIVTDTLPIPVENQFSNLTILPIAPLLARAIKEVFDEGSVASLFDHVGV